MPRDVYSTKVIIVVDSAFHRYPKVSLTKVKSEAKNICNELDLIKLCSSVDRSNNLRSVIFQRTSPLGRFSIKSNCI